MDDAQVPPERPMPLGGRRKDGKPFKDGNLRDDGSYTVGKNRTAPHTRFAKGDGKPRGRRPKGKPNADSEWEEELGRKVTFRENGKERNVTKARLNKIRAIDNAVVKGKHNAIEFVDGKEADIEARKAANARYHSKRNEEILHQYLKDREAELNIDPALFGDPEDLANAPVPVPETKKPKSGSSATPSNGDPAAETNNGR